MTASCHDPLLERLELHPRDRILELNCGEGEFSVLLAARVPEGLVAAVDPSDDRIRRARQRGRDLDNLMFFPGDQPQIPWKENFFSKALSHGLPESFADVLRVLVPGGMFYVTCGSGQGPASDWVSRLEAAGFAGAETHQLAENLSLLVGRKP